MNTLCRMWRLSLLNNVLPLVFCFQVFFCKDNYLFFFFIYTYSVNALRNNARTTILALVVRRCFYSTNHWAVLFVNYILITQKNCCRRGSTAWAKLPVLAEERSAAQSPGCEIISYAFGFPFSDMRRWLETGWLGARYAIIRGVQTIHKQQFVM